MDSYNLNQDYQDSLEAIVFESITDLELLSGDTFDRTIVTAANITPTKAIIIGIFSKFLYMQGDFRKFPTLPIMAMYNNRNRHSQDIDSGSNDDSRGMLKPSSHPVLPIFSNDVEDFNSIGLPLKERFCTPILEDI